MEKPYIQGVPVRFEPPNKTKEIKIFILYYYLQSKHI